MCNKLKLTHVLNILYMHSYSVIITMDDDVMGLMKVDNAVSP